MIHMRIVMEMSWIMVVSKNKTNMQPQLPVDIISIDYGNIIQILKYSRKQSWNDTEGFRYFTSKCIKKQWWKATFIADMKTSVIFQ